MHIILLLCLGSYPPDYQIKTFTVEVNNIKNSMGQVIIYIFRDATGFPLETDRAMRSSTASIDSGSATFSLSGLPPGKYAFSIIHDENSNGELDTNFLGMPLEGVCASNNAKGFLGPPKFKDAAFSFEKTPFTMNVKMIYF